MDSASKGTLTHRYPDQANAGYGLAQNGKGWGLAVVELTSIHSHKTRWKVPSYGSTARTSGTGEPTACSPRVDTRSRDRPHAAVGRMAQEAKARGNARDKLTWARCEGK